MNTKKAKAIRKTIHKNQRRVVTQAFEDILHAKLRNRLRLAWIIIRGRRKRG